MIARKKPAETKMNLILWRHAEAEDGGPKLPDAKRRLTERGEKQARQMARWLRDRLPKGTRILVSPTQRTQMTAHALGLPFELEPKIGPGADPAEILAAAGWPNHNGGVLVVGHQPTLGRVAAQLLSGQDGDWTIKKGAMWWFSNRMREDKMQMVLRGAIEPDFV